MRTVEVKVPVPVPCPEPAIPDPTPLPIRDLLPGAPAKQVAEAYAESIRVLQKDLATLRDILFGYRKLQPATPQGGTNGSQLAK